ncbi:unnamed protein product [Mytilus edulis]|uniref:Uncharacterized protein n=1 Tax=Mytilus edulis TaxID=6550 RepID=A0A8S3RC10_MYTED|nr:unnamed protein product [Mytilus edulis]
MKTNTVPVVIFFTVLCNNGGIYAVVHIGELDCSFETDFCEWNIVSSTNWTRYRYEYQPGSTGPKKAKDGDCVKSDVTSTIAPITTSGASTTSSTTEKEVSVIPASGGVIELLPIAIGVPCGVLLVGAIIVDRIQGLVRHPERPFTEINPYGGSPRHTIIEEEVYEEIDEAAMIGNDNGGYIDAVPPSYDEIGNVELRQNGNVGYINHKSERPPSEDYLTPISAQNIQPNRPNNDYSHSGPVSNERPQSDDYLKPGEFLKMMLICKHNRRISILIYV